MKRLVEALRRQTLSDPFEVVIVDDGSTDDTPAVLDALSTKVGSPTVTTLRQKVNAGPAVARNRGWRTAAGRLIAFTDDDCVPDPFWLEALVSALDEADIVQGRTIPDPEQRKRRGPFSRTISITHETGFYATCNIAYRRRILERFGGFDEAFPDAAGEDTDLAWRALKAGARSRFVGDALVYHDITASDFFAYLRHARRWSGVVRAVRLHPEIRSRLLYDGLFWKQEHGLALLASFGALISVAFGVARRPGWALGAWCAVVPYVHHRLRRKPLGSGRRQRALGVVGGLVRDTFECGVHVRASIRHRHVRSRVPEGPR